ncbi:MAG: serine hydrolase [Myxococcota bacterium]|nr:serine hydrolase [Myxococcota bacterium]
MSLNLEEKSLPEVDRCIQTALREKVFSGAACLASIRGKIFHRHVYGCLEDPPPLKKLKYDDLFDLASLSKPLGAGLVALHLAGRGRLDLGATIHGSLPIFSDDRFKAVTIDMLLDHTTGWPADADFWKHCSEQSNPSEAIKLMVKELPLVATPGTRVCYSDVGFMVLGWILEKIVNQPLDVYFYQTFLRPLELDEDLFFVRQSDFKQKRNLVKRRFVATEDCPLRGKRLVGEVHDPKAWLLDGVAGHAGLFGTIDGVWKLSEVLRKSWNGEDSFFHSGTVRRFWTRSNRPRNTTRTLAWDTPDARDSTVGNVVSRNTVGHLGFTGTSIWFDPSTELTMILLTNAVHPSPEGKRDRMRKFRVRAHELISKAAASVVSL